MREASESGQQEKLWTKDFVLVIFSAFFGATVFFCMGSGVPLFVDLLGGSATLTGVMTLGYGLGAIFGCLLGGRLCDIWGTRRVTIFFGIACAVVSFLPVLLPSLPVVVFMRISQGVLLSCFTVAIPSSVANLSPINRLGEGMGYSMMTMALSEALGPTLAIRLFEAGSGTTLFALAGGFLLISSALAWFRSKDRLPRLEPRPETADVKPKGLFIWRIIEKKALPIALVTFIFSFATAFIWNYLPLYVNQNAIPNYSVFFLLQFISMFLSRLVVGKLIDRRGPLYAFIPAVVSGIVGFIIILLGKTIFILSGIFYGLSAGIMIPLLNTVCLQNTPTERSGAALAALLISNNLGVGAGALLWGKVIDLSGSFQLALFGTVVCVAVTGCLGVLFIRKKTDGGSKLKRPCSGA